MAYNALIVTQEDGVLQITLNRPPMNPLSGELIEELGKVMDNEAAGADVKVIIVTGGDAKAFCAGADLKEGFGGDKVREFVSRGQSTFTRLERIGKPVIAAINGHALGGGCELALACHLRIAKSGARIGLPESNLGILPGYGGTQRLPRLINKAKAIELMITGGSMTAEEALAIGLVNSVCDDPLAEAKALAAKLTKRAGAAMALIIDAVLRGTQVGLDEGLAIEIDNFVKVAATEDSVEGIKAFIEKREANFKGK